MSSISSEQKGYSDSGSSHTESGAESKSSKKVLGMGLKSTSPPKEVALFWSGLCGYCRKVMLRHDITNEVYEKTCVCCKTLCKVHPNCAIKMINKNEDAEKMPTLLCDNSTFNKMDIEFYCELCKTNCFWCNVNHSSKFG